MQHRLVLVGLLAAMCAGSGFAQAPGVKSKVPIKASGKGSGKQFPSKASESGGIPELVIDPKMIPASPVPNKAAAPAKAEVRKETAADSTAEENRGMRALDGQKYAEAETAFAAALVKNPSSVVAQFHLALSQSLQAKDGEAIANFQKVLQTDPEMYEAQINLGVLYLRGKQYEAATEWLTKAYNKKPAEAQPNYYLAEAHSASANWEEAEVYFRKALGINAADPAAKLGLARSVAKQGRLKESLPYFRDAIAADASSKSFLLELAQAMEDKGQFKDAAELYKEFPENAVAQERLGAVLIQSGQAAQAVTQLEAAVKSSPTAANRLALATAYLRSQREADALPLLNDAVTLEPKNVELRLALGRIYRQMKQLDKAVTHFAEAVRYDTNSKVAWNDLSSTLFLAGQWEGAQSGFARARALGDTNPSLHYLEALCFDRMRLYKQAKVSYETFLSQSQNLPEEEFKARQRLKVVNKELERR